jgi:hypothetical protein
MGFLQRISEHIGELLSADEDDNKKTHKNTGSAHKKVETLKRPDDFEAHLKNVLSQEGQPLAGRVNFIGLAKIRETLGPKWDAIASRADEIARRAIERKLTDADVYTRYNDLQYLIIFSRLSKEQAQLKCALIAEEINKRLLGESTDNELLEVKTMVAAMGGKLQFEDVPSIGTLAARLAGEEGELFSSPDSSSKTAEIDPAIAEFPAQEGLIQGVASWEEADQVADPLEKMQILYRPMWGVRQNAIIGYECVPARLSLDGRLSVGQSKIPGLQDVEIARRLDLMVLRKGITDLRAAVASGRPVPIIFPVHFETLSGYTARMGFIELCFRGIPPEAHKYAIFLLSALPEGVPQPRLLEITRALRKHASAVMMLTTGDHRRVPLAAETGVAVTCYQFSGRSGAEAQEIQNINRFAAAAAKAGFRSAVYEAPTLSLVTASCAAGIDYIVSDIVGPVTDTPRGIYRFSVADLYRDRTLA